MDSHLVSQRQAAQMLRDNCGLSRRAAYYRLDTLEAREFLDTKVYSRVDVNLLCARLLMEKGEHHADVTTGS